MCLASKAEDFFGHKKNKQATKLAAIENRITELV